MHTAVQKERGPSKSNELKKELKSNYTVANELIKKKELKINFDFKEMTKEQANSTGSKQPVAKLGKNYNQGMQIIFAKYIGRQSQLNTY